MALDIGIAVKEVPDSLTGQVVTHHTVKDNCRAEGSEISHHIASPPEHGDFISNGQNVNGGLWRNPHHFAPHKLVQHNVADDKDTRLAEAFTQAEQIRGFVG